MSSVLEVGQMGLTTVEESDGLLAAGPCAKPSPRPLSLRSNFSWTFVGNVVYAGCQWGMLVVLAKLGSPEKVGQFALGLAVTAPIIMFSNLQLRAIQATDARREYRFGHYLALRLITTALALLVIAGIACGYRLETALVILAVGLAKAFESLSDVVYGLLQGHERMDRIALSMMIKGPLSLVALGTMVYLTASIAWGALALAGVWGLFLIAYDIPNGICSLDQADTFRPCWDRPVLTRLARLALPLAGFATGLTTPSRDMLIRAAATPSTIGRVFGLVYSGGDLGNALVAVVLGAILDHHAVMWIVPVIVAAYGGMICAALAAAPRRSA